MRHRAAGAEAGPSSLTGAVGGSPLRHHGRVRGGVPLERGARIDRRERVRRRGADADQPVRGGVPLSTAPTIVEPYTRVEPHARPGERGLNS